MDLMRGSNWPGLRRALSDYLAGYWDGPSSSDGSGAWHCRLSCVALGALNEQRR